MNSFQPRYCSENILGFSNLWFVFLDHVCSWLLGLCPLDVVIRSALFFSSCMAGSFLLFSLSFTVTSQRLSWTTYQITLFTHFSYPTLMICIVLMFFFAFFQVKCFGHVILYYFQVYNVVI